MAIAVTGLVLAPAAGAVDIPVTTANDTYGATIGSCSLREAVTSAQTDSAFDGCTAGSGADTIKLPAGSYEITRVGAGENLNNTGDFDVTGAGSLTIEPANATAKAVADGNGLDRVFHQIGASSLSIRNLTVTGGSLTGVEDGGGVLNQSGTLTLEGVTVRDNSSKISAGGIGVYDSLSMINSTVNGNAAGGNGGGLYMAGGSSATVRSSTISANQADSDASGNGDGGGFNESAATNVSFYNVINALNEDLSPNPGDRSPDCYSGTFFFPRQVVSTQALGSGDCLVGFDPGTNKLVADPLLGPLSDNGGQTLTRAPLAGSPAIAAGGTLGLDACPPIDQTGRARPAASCDAGAVQRVAPVLRPKLLIDRITPARAKVRRGKTVRITLTILNPGNKTANGVKACLKLKAGNTRKALKIKGRACKSLTNITAGARKKAVFKLMAKPGAKKKRFSVESSVSGTGLVRSTRLFSIKVK